MKVACSKMSVAVDTSCSITHVVKSHPKRTEPAIHAETSSAAQELGTPSLSNSECSRQDGVAALPRDSNIHLLRNIP